MIRLDSIRFQASLLVATILIGLIHLVWVESIWACGPPPAPLAAGPVGRHVGAGQGRGAGVVAEQGVRFDIASVVDCLNLSEMAEPDWAVDRPQPQDSQLLLIPLSLTTDLDAAARKQLREIRLEIRFVERGVEVFDYLPQTITGSDIEGPISVEETSDRNSSGNVNLSGSYEMVRGSVGLGGGKSEKTTKRYMTLPEQQLVAASGTLERRRGVYFKFLKSGQVAWDLERNVSLIARVPQGWRSGLLRVDVVAAGRRSSFPGLEQDVTLARQRFFVSYVSPGDREALTHARNLMERYAVTRQKIYAASRSTNARQPQLLDGMLGSTQSKPNLAGETGRWLVTGRYAREDYQRIARLDRRTRESLDALINARQHQLQLNRVALTTAQESGGPLRPSHASSHGNLPESSLGQVGR